MELGQAVKVAHGTRSSAGVPVGGRDAVVVDRPSVSAGEPDRLFVRFDDDDGTAEFFDWIRRDRLLSA